MDGILLVDKPSGMTSHDVVDILRRQLNERRIGHAGTLDPMASGLLVVAVGRATKFMPFFVESDKTYEAEITLGIGTDTDDAEGAVVATASATDIRDEDVDDALRGFLGISEQIPPAYAAIKVAGKKLYQYARAGKEMPSVSSRRIEVHALERTGPVVREGAVLRVPILASVSKGTYVRALARDLGARLGVPAMLSRLRRTRIDTFDVRMAHRLAEIDSDAFLLDPVEVLHLPRIILNEEMAFKARNGAFLPLSLFASPTLTAVEDPAGRTIAVYEPDQELGVMRLAVML
jgi:tRNA pseudouridine55 synthase